MELNLVTKPDCYQEACTTARPRPSFLPELQRNKDTVRCATLGPEVPGHRQEQLTETLIVRLLKTHFFTSILNFEKSTEYN